MKAAKKPSVTGDVASLKLWMSVPGVAPTYIIACTCGGEYRKLRHRDGMLTSEFRCVKCSRHIHITTEAEQQQDGLNEAELKVLLAMAEDALGNGGDFGCTNWLKVPGLTEKEVGGYITALQKKRLVEVHKPHDVGHERPVVQFTLSDKAWKITGHYDQIGQR